jgi:TonB family protein
MKLPKDQPFWTSVILHLVVLLALFLVTIVEAIKPKEEPHVFEMVAPQADAPVAVETSPAPPAPPVELPELAPVPEAVQPAPRPAPAPAPKPAAAKPAPTPTKPKLTTIDDFIRQHGAPKPRQQSASSQARPSITVPQIDPPKLVIPSNPSASRPSPQLTPQQMSALGSYSSQLRARIDAAWAKPSNLAGVRIAATVVFDVSASGRITNARLQPSSGNGAFDQSVLAAFRKIVSAGPTPTGQPHSFTMTFRMTD